MDAPWTRARKRRSQSQEERNGRLPGGSQQPNSGRIWRFKRDNKLYNFLVESRTNEKETTRSYTIKKAEFLQIEKEAFATPPGLLAAMQIDIQDLSLICIRLEHFQQLQKLIIELEAELENERKTSS